MIRFLRFSDAGFAETFREISERGETTPAGVLETVQGILTDVRERGDAALWLCGDNKQAQYLVHLFR